MRKLPFFLVAFLIFSLFQLRVVKAQESHVLEVTVNQDYYFVKGDTITVNAYSNVSVDATLRVYWNWRTFTENELIYSHTKTLNATWNLPTINQKPGFYRLEVSTSENTVTLWRTLIHYSDYSVESLPFEHTWKGIEYTLQGRSLRAYNGETWFNITYPKIPFEHSTSFYRNNMTFLVRLHGATWDVDLLYFTIHSGLKWAINGTLDNPQTFEFKLGNVEKWKRNLNRLRSNKHLVFDFDDLRLTGKVFSWNSTSKTLSVNIPSTFNVDPEIFNDGFESGYTPWTGTNTAGTGAIGISTDQVHHGVNSSLVSCDSDSDHAYSYYTFSEYNITYLRFYIYFENLSVNTYSEQRIGELGDSSAGWRVRAVVGRANGDPFWRMTVVESWAVTTTDGSNTPVVDTWYCVEILRDIDNDVQTLWINGAMECNDTVSITRPNERIEVGITHQYGDIENDWYYDCVIVHTDYVGCEVEGLDLAYTLFENIFIFSSVSTIYELVGLDLSYLVGETIFFYDSAYRSLEKSFTLGEVIRFFDSVSTVYEGIALNLFYVVGETIRIVDVPSAVLEVAVTALTLNDVLGVAAIAFLIGIIALILVIAKMGQDLRK